MQRQNRDICPNTKCRAAQMSKHKYSAGRMWIVLPALLAWFCGDASVRVGGLGPGLTSDSADAASAVLRNDLPAGSQVICGTHRRAGLICPSCARGRGSQVRRPAGACPPFNQRQGMALTRVEDARAVTGGVDTHADMHVAAPLDPVGACSASGNSRPRRPAMPACWAG